MRYTVVRDIQNVVRVVTIIRFPTYSRYIGDTTSPSFDAKNMLMIVTTKITMMTKVMMMKVMRMRRKRKIRNKEGIMVMIMIMIIMMIDSL